MSGSYQPKDAPVHGQTPDLLLFLKGVFPKGRPSVEVFTAYKEGFCFRSAPVWGATPLVDSVGHGGTHDAFDLKCHNSAATFDGLPACQPVKLPVRGSY